MVYEKVGLKVGLEVHQQLDTKHKLFCSCPTQLEDTYSIEVTRMLRPVKSELGEVDPAALFEYIRGRRFVYQVTPNSSCLVELDEEPPHELNREAVEIALTVALMLDSRPLEEIHVMRKEVIDGSNTTGFQRTAIVALGGRIKCCGRFIGIETICVEEDAARKIREEGNTVVYRLDRLGIPLIEVATAPDIHTPKEAMKVALSIGRLLRSTGKVKRGLGTIRQDLNISIEGGAKTEVKGVQELELIPKVIENEVKRQLRLLKLKEILNERLDPNNIEFRPLDVTDVFKECKSRLIQRGVKKGYRVYALKLPRMAGLLGFELQPGSRFGTELSYYARFWGGVTGIIHTDELPKYGITQDDVDKLRGRVGASEEDAIVITIGSEEACIEALRAVYKRVLDAFEGVPEETRSVKPDGTTVYSRPRPGSARMYPETDIPPMTVTPELIERLRARLPKTWEEMVKELILRDGLNRELAEAVVDSRYYDVYKNAVAMGVNPKLVARVLTQSIKSLRREGVDVNNIDEERLLEVFKLLSQGRLVKEAVDDVLRWLAENPLRGVDDALKSIGISVLSEEAVEKLVERIIRENEDTIKSLGPKALGFVMKRLMRKIRGRFDGGAAKRIVERKLKGR